MKNILNFLEKWGKLIIVVLLLITVFRTCGNTSKIDDIKENTKENKNKIETLNDSIKKINNRTFSKKEMKYMQEQVMFRFLLYENEIDKNKITLPEIKEKIDK